MERMAQGGAGGVALIHARRQGRRGPGEEATATAVATRRRSRCGRGREQVEKELGQGQGRRDGPRPRRQLAILLIVAIIQRTQYTKTFIVFLFDFLKRCKCFNITIVLY